MTEGLFEWRIAGVGIEIGRTRPAQPWLIQINIDAGAWSEGAPAVLTGLIKRDRVIDDGGRMHANAAADTGGNGHGDLVDVDHEFIAFPVQRTRSDMECSSAAIKAVGVSFCHRPAFATSVIERDVKGAVVIRISRSAPPLGSVVGREDTADESDQGDRMLSIVTERI